VKRRIVASSGQMLGMVGLLLNWLASLLEIAAPAAG
jgi:hypothetical protein